jgi:hypothetical protein
MQPEPAHDDPPPLPCTREHMLGILALYPLAFVVAAFVLDSPGGLLDGLLAILRSRDTLTTDYLGLGGIGAALLNAGLLTLAAVLIYWRSGAAIGGGAVAAMMLMLGFGLFGKNLLNIWGIVVGVWLYARFKGEPFAKHVNTAFFGAALAPVFSEILFSSALSLSVSLPLALGTTLLMGFLLAPVAAHLFQAHQGHSLYNMGFVTGMLGTLTVAIYKSYGFVPDPVFIWTQGNNGLLGTLLLLMFISMGAIGRLLDRQVARRELRLMRRSGRSPTDFVAIFGFGPTLLNMALTGLMGTAYVIAVGSDLNGPTIGAILCVVGFSAFGKHPKNIVWIMLGVFLASITKNWNAGDPSMVLAALFGTTLAPIAGRFGWHWGLVAGFVHSSVAQTVGQLHGGLVLYNNGFAAGLVAAVLLPVILALRPPRQAPAR